MVGITTAAAISQSNRQIAVVQYQSLAAYANMEEFFLAAYRYLNIPIDVLLAFYPDRVVRKEQRQFVGVTIVRIHTCVALSFSWK